MILRRLFGSTPKIDPRETATRPTFHGYAAATRMRPEWRVQFLVFQAGRPKTRGNSITGGGQMYAHEFAGFFQPVIYPNAPGIGSFVGGGQIPASPAEVFALFGGAQGKGPQ